MRTALLLLLLLVPTAVTADATQSTGGGAHDGFRLHDDRLDGTRLDAATTPTGLGAVTLDSEPLLAGLDWQTGTWSVDGPLARLNAGDGNLSVHDNRFGWITLRGEPGTVTLTGTTDWSVDAAANTATAGPARLFLERPATLAADGDTLTVTSHGPTGLAVTTEPGIFGHAPRAGAWAVVHVDPADPTTATADWLLVHSAPFHLADAGPGLLALDLVGTLGDGAPDLLVRLDLHGLPDGGLVLRMADRVAVPVAAGRILDDGRGPLSFNATTHADGGRTVLLRLPAGLSGHLTLRTDDAPPAVTVTTSDLDPWAPQERMATLLAVADEPGTATLRIGAHYEKRTVLNAYEHTFRLVGLQPATSYDYELRVRDLAGNERVLHDTLQTGNATGGSRHIQATAAPGPDGAWRVTANVTDVTGAPVRAGVSFFVDKQATPAQYRDGVWVLVLEDAEPGPHEVAVEALGPDGRTREVLLVEVPEPVVDAEAPLPPAAAPAALLVALALAARRTGPQPPQP